MKIRKLTAEKKALRRSSYSPDENAQKEGPSDQSDMQTFIHSDEAKEKKRRINFAISDDGSRVDWDGFKSDKGRNIVRNLIRSEAEAMGLVAPPSEVADSLGLNADAVLSIYNTAVLSTVPATTHCPQKVAEILAFDEKEREAINAGGAGDRLVQKYIGAMSFKYRDELVVGMTLAPLMVSKLMLFRNVMLDWKKKTRSGQLRSVPTVTSVTSKENVDDSRTSRTAASGQDDSE